MAIAGANGTCPCVNCQLHLKRTPKQRALIARAKLRGDLALARRIAGKKAK